MDKYIIQGQITFETEAEDENVAKELAIEKFKLVENLKCTIAEVKVVHKKSGYFV